MSHSGAGRHHKYDLHSLSDYGAVSFTLACANCLAELSRCRINAMSRSVNADGGRCTSHHVPLDKDWTVWRHVALRSTGFPIRELERLRDADTTSALDAIAVRRSELASQFEVCIQMVRVARQVPDAPTALRKLFKRLCAYKLPREDSGVTAIDVELSVLLQLEHEVAQARADFELRYDKGLQRQYAALRALAADSRFREAIAWQNPKLVHSALDKLTEAPKADGLRYYHLVAQYLQRYTTKNETIGFFGPSGWAELRDDDESGSLVAGDEFLAERKVYFEHWAIQAVADCLSSTDAIKPFAPIRLDPKYRIENSHLIAPSGRKTLIPATLAEVLRKSVGGSAISIVAEVLGADCDSEDREELYFALESLQHKGIVHWGYSAAPQEEDPEIAFALWLKQLPGDVGGPAKALFDDLLNAKDQLARAAGDDENVLTAQASLAKTFEDITGVDAERSPGEAYAGRLVAFEDTLRSMQVSIGREFTEHVAAPLSLVLKSAAWFCSEASRRFMDVLFAKLEVLCPHESDEVALLEVMAFASEIMAGSLVSEMTQDLHDKWESVIGALDSSPMQLASDDLRAAVDAAFPADGPGWPEARFHSPDLMIAAPDFSHLSESPLVVLGEVHPGRNTLFAPSTYWLSPVRDELVEAFRDDISVRLIEAVTPPSLVTRADLRSPLDTDYEIEIGAAPSRRVPELRLAVADMRLQRSALGFSLNHRDRELHFDCMSFFQAYLRGGISTAFSLTKKRRHHPRLTVDSLVLVREHWTFDPTEIPFLKLRRGAELLLAANTWAREEGLAMRCFVKVPEENKPMYIDFNSAISVESLAKLLRSASSVFFSEMLPTPEQSWLEDAAGERYASELRIVACDRRRWNSNQHADTSVR